MDKLYDEIDLASAHELFTFNEDVIKDAIDALYDNEGFDAEMLGEDAGRNLIYENYRVLSDAIDKGVEAHEKSTHDVTKSINQKVPDDLKMALKNNALLFAGWKSYHTMNEAGLSLFDEKSGAIKSFSKFSQEAGEVFKKQKLNLRAEYNHGVASAQMAAHWNDIEEDGDRYDLQYRTAGDDKVREVHRKLQGTTLPPSDKFWASFYPPNGWNCRCRAVQVRRGKYKSTNTSDEAIDLGNESTAKPKQKMFRTNTGKQQRIYPKKHPYFPKDCGSCDRNVNLAYDANNPRCKGCMAIKSCIDNELVETTSKKWIKDAIEKTKDGYCCKRAITIGDVPSEVIQFAKKRGVELKDTTIKVTDNAIRHAIRDNKTRQSISNQQMENISSNIKSAKVYYDNSKNNYMFICKDGEELIKYIVNCNYTNKADGKKITGNFFVTAGKVNKGDTKNKIYTKIK